MNFNLFPVIAASAISASVVLPAHAHADSSKACPLPHGPMCSPMFNQRTMIALNSSEASHPSSQLRTRG